MTRDNFNISCRTCICGCKQAWSDDGETLLVSVAKTGKFDGGTPAVDCSDEEFRSIEASLYQVLHRTTANAPLRSLARDYKEIRSEEHVRQKKIRICSTDQQQGERAKDVEQFDDILRMFVMRRTNMRFGIMRDEEKLPRV